MICASSSIAFDFLETCIYDIWTCWHYILISLGFFGCLKFRLVFVSYRSDRHQEVHSWTSCKSLRFVVLILSCDFRLTVISISRVEGR